MTSAGTARRRRCQSNTTRRYSTTSAGGPRSTGAHRDQAGTSCRRIVARRMPGARTATSWQGRCRRWRPQTVAPAPRSDDRGDGRGMSSPAIWQAGRIRDRTGGDSLNIGHTDFGVIDPSDTASRRSLPLVVDALPRNSLRGRRPLSSRWAPNRRSGLPEYRVPVGRSARLPRPSQNFGDDVAGMSTCSLSRNSGQQVSHVGGGQEDARSTRPHPWSREYHCRTG